MMMSLAIVAIVFCRKGHQMSITVSPVDKTVGDWWEEQQAVDYLCLLFGPLEAAIMSYMWCQGWCKHTDIHHAVCLSVGYRAATTTHTTLVRMGKKGLLINKDGLWRTRLDREAFIAELSDQIRAL